jgi:tRNA A-37 threonylcarbamoyl transferase component Bud32
VSWIPRIGTEFAGYRLDSLLGHGGMSIVYQAEHLLLTRKVALKLLSPQLSEDESFRERFMRESQIAASLDHPNIIPIYEAAESEGVFFIAMRYVEGADLQTLLKQGPLEPQRLISIIDQTANALSAAHARGLVHRDVKPANILIDPGEARGESDHVYLSDFGVAKKAASHGLTKTGVFVGTAEYAAPEQIEGKELDARADVYSLGCVIYECLTGMSAYDKDSEVALMYAHLLEPPPSVFERRPDLPAELDAVVGKAMAKSRDQRYEGPKELATALRDVLAGVSTVAAQPTGSAPETVLASDAVPQTPAGATVAASGATAAASGATAAASGATRTASGATAAASGGETTAAEPAATGQPDTQAPPRRERRLARPAILAVAVTTAVAIGLAIALAIVATGGGSKKNTSSGAGTNPKGGGAVAPAKAEDSLLAVLVPSNVANMCKVATTPSPTAVETDTCAASAAASTDVPDSFQFDFYKNGQALETAYEQRMKGLKPASCGSNQGDREWFHPTGKLGGQRECFLDSSGRFVIVWTHEKLDSDDHVDMLGTATEPGRAPTTFRSWWNAVNDNAGKCRPKVAFDTCEATIKKIVPTA